MSEFVSLLLRLMVILNPIGAGLIWVALGALLAPRRGGLGLLAAGIAFGLLALAVLLGADLLDALDVSPPTWEIGTGVLLLFGVLNAFLRRDPFAPEPYATRRPEMLAVARAALMVANPAALAALLFHGVDAGRGQALAALAIVMALVAGAMLLAPRAEARVGRLPLREAGRFVAMVLVLLAVGMIIDGINAV